jgi:type II secretory pathway predicted ATPase ExeA
VEHLRHFSLAEDPFRNDHVERFCIETPSVLDALRRVDRAVRQSKGLVVLLGQVGAGKTLVARRLYEELEEEVFEAAMLVLLRPQVDPRWLLDRFAAQLGVEEPAAEHDALLAQVYERLAIIREDGRHAVLIIDDAHRLATPEILAELFGLAKLEYEDRGLLSVVLVGGAPLEEALAADPLFAHHVDVRVRLQPLDRETAATYLGQRIQVAGGDPGFVLPGAVAGLHELSGGWPGRVNILADNALFEAYLAGRNELTRSDVERACDALGWGGASAGADRAVAAPGDPAAAHPAGVAAAPLADAPVVTPGRERPAAAADLDSELEAVFDAPAPGRAETQQTVVMDFDAGNVPASRPAPAHADAAPTEIELEPSDAVLPGSPPKKHDEVDDLFMELLDD